MRSFTTVLFTAVLSSVASAQYTIDPASVPISTRNGWCQNQISQCPLICLQTAGNSAATEANSCDAASLSYGCVCSNGIAPNISEYSQTLPYYVCTEWGNQCVAACGQDNLCSSNCRSQHPCGAQNPTRANTSTLTSSMSRTSSGVPAGASSNSAGVVYTGFGGAAATTTGGSSGSSQTAASSQSAQSTQQSGAQQALKVGQAYGIVVLAAGLFGGFALLL